MFGLGMGTLGFILYGLAPSGYIFWAMMPVAAFWGVAQPAAQALTSHMVDPREQGRLQGATTSISSIAGIFGAGAFPLTFSFVADSKLQGVAAGATFFLAAAILAVDLLLAWYISTHLPASIRDVVTAKPNADEVGSASDVRSAASEATESQT